MDARIAFVHDWLIGMRGGEKCLHYLCQLYPHADLFALIAQPKKLSDVLRSRPLRTSLLQCLPLVYRYHRFLLPLMPAAIRMMQVRGYDLVLSSSSCVAKSVRTQRHVPHICYCHTPMRYAWHMRDVYVESIPKPLRPVAGWILDQIREWDRATSTRVTQFIANSTHVSRRIKEAYGRESLVVNPPVDIDYYQPSSVEREEYYLVVSALVPYKRVDLAIEACARLGRPLLIIGTGDAEARLRAQAKGMVTFAGWQSNDMIRHHMQRCRALLFPGEEDFGIVPLEAMACGTPIIALGRGGATETVVPWGDSRQPTGYFFEHEDVEEMVSAMTHFEKHRHDFAPLACRRRAEQFSIPVFQSKIKHIIEASLIGADPEQALRKAA